MEFQNSNTVGLLLKNNCPLCGRERTYKTKQGFEKGVNKPCRSCANSISAGGGGWTPLCIDCGVNPREKGYNSQCKSCHNKRSMKYHKETYRWAKYGLDGPIEMKACEICGTDIDLVIDHCHDSNIFRGVLCRTCNMGIGHLREDADTVEKAFKYLRRFNESITENSQ